MLGIQMIAFDHSQSNMIAGVLESEPHIRRQADHGRASSLGIIYAMAVQVSHKRHRPKAK